MSIMSVLLLFIFLPLVFLALELLLCKVSMKFALFFPIFEACLFLFLGFYALITAALMYAVFFIMRYLKKEREQKEKERASEIEKMKINDL